MAKANRKAVLKDFGDLRPVEQRIEQVAHAFLQLAFRGQVLTDFQPKSGTQVFRAWKMCKLDERMQIAWTQFCDDVQLAHGKSGSTTSAYGESQDKGDGSDFRVPVARTNVYYRRVEKLLTEFLDRQERALLYALLQDHLRGNGSLELETIGVVNSAYHDKVSARASGVTHLQCLLRRMASYYGV